MILYPFIILLVGAETSINHHNLRHVYEGKSIKIILQFFRPPAYHQIFKCIFSHSKELSSFCSRHKRLMYKNIFFIFTKLIDLKYISKQLQECWQCSHFLTMQTKFLALHPPLQEGEFD